MPKGPIPLKVHAAIEPIVAIVLIAAPWIFGFDDVGSATAVSVIVGVLMLISGMSTRWRLSIVKLIPLRTHFLMDLVLGVVLIAAPFVLGDSDRGDATRFLVIMGILELRDRARHALGPARGTPPACRRHRRPERKRHPLTNWPGTCSGSARPSLRGAAARPGIRHVRTGRPDPRAPSRPLRPTDRRAGPPSPAPRG